MGSSFFELLNAGGYAAALNLLAEKVAGLAVALKFPAIVTLMLAAIMAIVVGAIGYKYIKVVVTGCFAFAGYAIGEAIFKALQAKFGWNVPGYAPIIAGAVLLVLLGFLAYKKFAYALFGLAGFATFVFAYLFIPNYVITIAIGAVAAMAAMYFVRYAFILITSCSAGAILMAMIAAMAPQARLLQLDGVVGKILAISAALIFISVQLTATKKESKKFAGPKRVKIRRVFDAW